MYSRAKYRMVKSLCWQLLTCISNWKKSQVDSDFHALRDTPREHLGSPRVSDVTPWWVTIGQCQPFLIGQIWPNVHDWIMFCLPEHPLIHPKIRIPTSAVPLRHRWGARAAAGSATAGGAAAGSARRAGGLKQRCHQRRLGNHPKSGKIMGKYSENWENLGKLIDNKL